MESFLFLVDHSLLVAYWACSEQHSDSLCWSLRQEIQDCSEKVKGYFVFIRIHSLISLLYSCGAGRDLSMVILSLVGQLLIEVHLGSIIIKVNLPYFMASVFPWYSKHHCHFLSLGIHPQLTLSHDHYLLLLLFCLRCWNYLYLDHLLSMQTRLLPNLWDSYSNKMTLVDSSNRFHAASVFPNHLG